MKRLLCLAVLACALMGCTTTNYGPADCWDIQECER